ncbi:UDP-2,4-diacetamido-2,4,6-trideoxy-beta-L-altropyranose hydrolase [Neptuniibacter sp. QD34_54]|uniref:UDP-2,4-diacetamido-2,4, 6-trideoxy-beta-L-altropyranose hydrolase n=1 Tax=Neptuniibacter sp. QD34_54 TaxID=3398208 RepID=UPI0039F637CD
MKVIFRVDSSITMGSGHVMRCLTLAEALTRHGAICRFICAEHNGNLIELISQRGYLVHSLPLAMSTVIDIGSLAHSSWLGRNQAEDAALSLPFIQRFEPDWLIIDHYALDYEWESSISALVSNIMVIDDLADRRHDCDILLDQTFGRNKSDYKPLVPAKCALLCGTHYALLRPEFSKWRYAKKSSTRLDRLHVLINLGGVDKDNYTGEVLKQIKKIDHISQLKLSIVMGSQAPWLDSIRELANELQCETTVLVGVNNMAELMHSADISIGAAGSTSWERCCLGLPTIMLVTADNQRLIATVLHEEYVAILTDVKGLNCAINDIMTNNEKLSVMSSNASRICDGEGAARVINTIESIGKVKNSESSGK